MPAPDNTPTNSRSSRAQDFQELTVRPATQAVRLELVDGQLFLRAAVEKSTWLEKRIAKTVERAIAQEREEGVKHRANYKCLCPAGSLVLISENGDGKASVATAVGAIRVIPAGEKDVYRVVQLLDPQGNEIGSTSKQEHADEIPFKEVCTSQPAATPAIEQALRCLLQERTRILEQPEQKSEPALEIQRIWVTRMLTALAAPGAGNSLLLCQTLQRILDPTQRVPDELRKAASGFCVAVATGTDPAISKTLACAKPFVEQLLAGLTGKLESNPLEDVVERLGRDTPMLGQTRAFEELKQELPRQLRRLLHQEDANRRAEIVEICRRAITAAKESKVYEGFTREERRGFLRIVEEAEEALGGE